ncbi:phospholipase [Nostoc sp. FACHB-87]|uniref:DISARM system phospholipase D-like protein DrmC n=1 Tax=Nostocaceae TaxID=1162 RepID=UPI001688654C|nr:MULTISPECIES: DISARM system phospholipase D-like protein DrmC [Nostocaceae]MBD2457062.1 phospholipase [Nostoc sp. FACHB-87]MBD2478248.1 phospholipase [Anabaena sp. FACHB-83]MBD2497542.1 phospholipase [Nostoc sp. FACHB-280]
MTAFLQLSRPVLLSLATAFETGRLHPPFSISTIKTYVPEILSSSVVEELNRLNAMGATPGHIAYTLRLLAAERSASQEVHDRVELVWTGQEVVGSQSRDTSVVVRELFSTAKSSILISSFAVDKGKKAQALFGVLASRMDANLELNVRMFLNVKRTPTVGLRPSHNNKLPESTLLKEFADTFRQEIWTGQRLPEVFYDPRSLAPGAGTKACLHAKCVVVDEERLLVTSANFTEAAHERNIEAGVLIDDPVAAKGMRSQFETLVAKNILRRVPGI